MPTKHSRRDWLAATTLGLTACSQPQKPGEFSITESPESLGGQKAIILRRAAATNAPTLLEAEILPGRGFNTWQLRAYIPGKGITDLFTAPSLTEAAKRKDVNPPRFDLDIVDLNSVSDICGTLLAGSLAALRRKGSVISFRGLESTLRRLVTPLQTGTRSHKGQWYLVLELLQWSANTVEFEDRAVDFAVTFEISPPSCEPLSAIQRSVLNKQAEDPLAAQDLLVDDRVTWLGDLKGAANPCLKLVAVDVATTNPVVVDMRQVSRVDFVCGGAIANAFTRLMAQAIDVRVLGASPIIQILLQLTGVPATLFAKGS